MASFIPNHRKKIQQLSKKEQQLRRLVEHGAGLETLLTVALEIRNCRIRVLKAKQNKNPERNAEERTEFLRDGKRIRVLQSRTAESILTEFFRSVVSN